MGLGFGIEPTLFEQTHDISSEIVLTLAERTGYIVLDYVIKTMLAQPFERLFFPSHRNRCVYHHLPRHGQALYVYALHPHLIHNGWDVFHRELVLLLLQCLEVAFSILDLHFYRAKLFYQAAESFSGFSID